MADSRLNYDTCSYTEQLKRSIGPGLYNINTPYNDCDDCGPVVPNDPFLRFQTYGPNACNMKNAIDDNSELLGLNYKNTKCNSEEYLPGKYKASGCTLKTDVKNICGRPNESTKLSNPPCTLRGTGINRWQWLCHDPQIHALEDYDHIPVNTKTLFKDNHVPCISKPIQDNLVYPTTKIENDLNLDKWQESTKMNKYYAPGYPYGNDLNNYNLNCKSELKSY